MADNELTLPDDNLPPDVAAESKHPAELMTVRAPLGEIKPDSHVSRHVDSRLTAAQGLALKRLVAGLDASHARLANGRPVVTGAEAMRWLLEQIGEKEKGK